MSRNWIKTPAPALLDRLYKDAVRACSGTPKKAGDDLQRYLRKVQGEYQKLLEKAGVYVEHAGMPEVNTEAWRQRDRADEQREISWLALARRIV